MSKLIVPQWPQPKGVAACSSTRIGGVSLPPYDSLNLGAHCGDNPDHVDPLVGDPVYGGRPRPPKGASEAFISTLRKFDRQALHATMLRLYHPISGIEMEWHAPIPQDMVELIEVMRADFEEHKDEVDWL